LAQRSRKRGQRRKPRAKTAGPVKGPKAAPGRQTPAAGSRPSGSGPKRKAETPPQSVGGWRVEPRLTRSQRRDAEVRAGLVPIRAGERPGPIVVGAIISGLIGAGQLIAFFAGLKIHGKSPAAGGTIGFCVLMIICAIGMWRLWYGAVLAFMALLAIVATLFSLYLIEASNVLGLVVALVVVGGAGYLFFKLVRVLSRIQMPQRPGH
jgi:hypothetical protein